MTIRADVTVRALLRLTAAGLVASALAGCASTPPEEDPVQIKLKDLDTRLARIERVMANQSLLESPISSRRCAADVRAMHNDVDELSNSLEASRKQQRDLYADLDQRMKNLEARGGGAAVAATGASAAGGARNVAAASANLGRRRSSERESGKTPPLSSGVQSVEGRPIRSRHRRVSKISGGFPASSLADNAQYWLGEAYYVNKSFPEARRHFSAWWKNIPQSRKLPDALLKIGYCRYELKAMAVRQDGACPSGYAVSGYPRRASGAATPRKNGDPRNIESRTRPKLERLRINEIFHSLQGEADASASHGVRAADGLSAALPVLRHRICLSRRDEWFDLDAILEKVRGFGAPHVCVTGGEPLAQPNCLKLLERLVRAGFHVSLETSGASTWRRSMRAFRGWSMSRLRAQTRRRATGSRIFAC